MLQVPYGLDPERREIVLRLCRGIVRNALGTCWPHT